MWIPAWRILPWFEDPAIYGVSSIQGLVLRPEEQRCGHCDTTDPPCVTPFLTNLFPNKMFCSAYCIQQRWESQNSQPYRSVVSGVETLDTETKNKVFGEAIKLRVKSDENATEVIERIKRIDDRVGNRFKERAALLENITIRMVYLGQGEEANKTQNKFDLRDPSPGSVEVAKSRIDQIAQHLRVPVSAPLEPVKPNSFIAVSYPWHNYNWNLSPSVRDDTNDTKCLLPKSPISQKMLDTISLLRIDEKEPIWVDQICIDQDNPAEQEKAIASMDIIYSAARVVAIVLEDVELTREELRVWRRHRERKLNHKGTHGKDNPFGIDSKTSAIIMGIMSKICSARWVTRAWCYHEYLLAQKYVFLVPCEGSIVLLSPKPFQKAMEYRLGIPAILGNERYPARGFIYKLFTDRKYRSVTDLLVFLHSRQARFLTDKMSILLNLHGKNLAYDGSPISQDEFCYTCIAISLAEGDIGALCNSGPQLQIYRSNLQKSWARWPCENRFFDLGPIPHTGTFKVVSPYEIIVDLYFLSGKPVQPSRKSMKTAWALFQSEDTLAMMQSITIGVRSTSQHFIEALAVGLDCGFDWINSVSRTIYEHFGAKRQTGLDKVFRDNRARAGRVSQLLIERSGVELPQSVDAAVAAENILKFVLLLLAYELPLKATVLTTSSGSPVATTFGPTGTVLAVPKDLAHEKFMAQNRLWFLEPTNGFDGKDWKIACKGMLFSPIGLSEIPGHVSLRNGQSVLG